MVFLSLFEIFLPGSFIVTHEPVYTANTGKRNGLIASDTNYWELALAELTRKPLRRKPSNLFLIMIEIMYVNIIQLQLTWKNITVFYKDCITVSSEFFRLTQKGASQKNYYILFPGKIQGTANAWYGITKHICNPIFQKSSCMFFTLVEHNALNTLVLCGYPFLSKTTCT